MGKALGLSVNDQLIPEQPFTGQAAARGPNQTQLRLIIPWLASDYFPLWILLLMATRALYFPASILAWKDIEKVAGRGLGFFFFFDRLNFLLLLTRV